MKKILLLLFLVPVFASAQVEKYIPHNFLDSVRLKKLTASLPLKLNIDKTIISGKITVTDADTTVGVGIIAWPRMAKLRDSLAALLSGGSGVTNVATGLGLSGGPITSTGTILADTNYLMTKGTSQLISGGKVFTSQQIFYENDVTGGQLIKYQNNGSNSGTKYMTLGLMGSTGASIWPNGALWENQAAGGIFASVYGGGRFQVQIGTGRATIVSVGASGLFSGGTTTPAAWLHAAAGTTTVPPILLTSGTPLTSIVNGALEFHSSHLYFSIGGVRYQLDQQGGGGGVTDITGTANQIIASGSTGSVTLSTPQDIHSAATPQFAKLGLGAASSASTYLNLAAGTTGISSLRIPASGSIPSSPVDGDLWRNGSSELRFYDGAFAKKLDNSFILQATADANITIGGSGYIIDCSTISSNRTVTFPAAQIGDEVMIWVSNSAGFTWSISGTPTATDAAGNAITTLTNDTIYRFVKVATNGWLKVN